MTLVIAVLLGWQLPAGGMTVGSAVRAGSSMAIPRRHHNATLLPDGHLVVVGGDEVSVFPLDLATGALRLPIMGSPFAVRGLQPAIVLVGP